MADADDKVGPAPPTAGEQVEMTSAADDGGAPKVKSLEPPEIIRNMTPEQRHELEVRVKRKIDFRILPMIVLMYILNYIDRYVFLCFVYSASSEKLSNENLRNNIAAARYAGLEDDLKLDKNGTQFSVSTYESRRRDPMLTMEDCREHPVRRLYHHAGPFEFGSE